MNSIKACLFLFLVFTFLFSCSTGGINVKTEPEDVTISLMDSTGNKEKLGKAGFFKSDQIFTGRIVKLFFSKEGYLDQTVVLTKPLLPTTFSLSIKMKPEKHVESGAPQLEKMARGVARAYKAINHKDYDHAIRILMELVNEYPDVSVPYDFLGNIYYMKKDFNTAYKYYRAALRLNPDNFERKEIVNKLEKMISPVKGSL